MENAAQRVLGAAFARHGIVAAAAAVALVLATCPGVGLAQGRNGWQIPAAGAVEYRRVGSASASVACKSSSAAAAAACDADVPATWLGKLPPAPFVCAGELDDDGRELGGQVADLRDVMRAVVCRLGSRSASRSCERLLPFGDLEVRGNWSSVDDSGVQQLRAKVVARPPARRGNEPKQWAERLRAFCVDGLRGELRAERVFDAAAGVVSGFRAELDLVVDDGERGFRRLRVEEQWLLEAVRHNQDFDFRKRVAAAIRGGVDWVRRAIVDRKSYLDDKRGERNYGSGRLALALLALLHGGADAADEAVVRGFGELRRRRIDDAYSLATALMAAEALARRRQLDARELDAAAGWLRRLLACIDPRVDTAELLRFNYEAGPRYDTSLQQYGLLGMRAAQRLGLELPVTAFAAAARHLLAVQAARGMAHVLELVDHDALRTAPPDAEPVKVRHRCRARGFAYREADEPPFGSMTSAGTSGLLLARAGLLAQGDAPRHAALLRRIDEALADGFGWLAANFCVRCNPGDAERADNHWYYWLYCLERCCELHRVARLDGRDWYYEGGLQLLAAQQPGGSFRSAHSSTLQLDATCFAILFLAKASAQGPITPR